MKHEQEKLIFPRIIMWDLALFGNEKDLKFKAFDLMRDRVVFKFCKESEFFMISMYEYDKWFVGIYELVKFSSRKR